MNTRPKLAPAVASASLRDWIWPVVVMLAWLALYWNSVAAMASIWMRSDTFAHGMVVAPISVWLAWRKQFWRSGLLPRPTLLAQPGVLLFALAWLAGVMVSAASLEHLAVVGVLVCALWGVLGNGLARLLAFPLCFLFFAAPVGEFLVPALMEHTAEFTVWALRITGIPVFQEGLNFVLPNGRWSVVEACSGVRYLIASMMVGSLYAYLTYTGWRKRLLFVIASIAMPIVANWLRAYLIVMIGYISDNTLATGVDHLVYGWLFFGIVIFIMFWIGSFWRDPEIDAALAVVPRNDPDRGVGARHARVAVLMAALTLPALASVAVAPVDVPVVARLELPPAGGGWETSDAPPRRYQPDFAGYREAAFSSYLRGDTTVGVWAMLYANQIEGRELVNWINQVQPAEVAGEREWSRLVLSSRTLSIGKVMYARLAGPAGEVDVFHWYQVDDRVVGSDIEAKLLLGVSRLRGEGDASVHVVLATPADDAGSAERIESFLADNWARLRAAIQDAMESVH